MSRTPYSPGSGISGADAQCQSELGGEGIIWKALLVGGGRIASISPYRGDGQSDWVLKPYTRYYNWEGRLIWTTEDIALVGISGGTRNGVTAPAWSFDAGYYPWSGYADDWTASAEETCNGWTSDSSSDRGAFVFEDLTHANVEPCHGAQFLLCVEQ